MLYVDVMECYMLTFHEKKAQITPENYVFVGHQKWFPEYQLAFILYKYPTFPFIAKYIEDSQYII